MRGCTQCGECLNVCPVFRQHWREEFSPKGKRLLLEPVKEGDGAFSWDEVFALARLCAGCGRCKQACARKLSTADLLAEVRAAHPHWTQHLWELWIRHMGPLWPALGLLASLAPRALTPGALESTLATARALRPPRNVRPWARAVARATAGTERVVLFPGCTARNVRPEWAEKAEGLLRAAGHAVCGPAPFVCCGGTLRHAGQFAAVEAMRRANVAVWREMGKPRIAVLCASCHAGLAEYAGGFLQGGEADEWRRSLAPLTALLGGLDFAALDAKPAVYGYHQPCHWETDADLPFLARALPGLRKGEGVCCGMGGILKMTDPDLSADMARSCLRAMDGEAAQVLTGCSGCAMQLAAFAPEGMSVLHWLDVVETG